MCVWTRVHARVCVCVYRKSVLFLHGKETIEAYGIETPVIMGPFVRFETSNYDIKLCNLP